MKYLSSETLNQIFEDRPAVQSHDWQKSWAAVGLIFRKNPSDELELLFIERAQHPDDAWSGHMAFPGGRREEGESILETARREVFEEVGLDLGTRSTHLGYLPGLRAYKFGKPQNFSLIPAGFLLEEDQALNLDPNEVAQAFWISLPWLLDHTNHSEFSYKVDLREILLPCIPLTGNQIWGLTYKVLAEIQVRLEKI